MSIKVQHNRKVEFPAVTVCTNNLLVKRKVLKDKNLADLGALENYEMSKFNRKYEANFEVKDYCEPGSTQHTLCKGLSFCIKQVKKHFKNN